MADPAGGRRDLQSAGRLAPAGGGNERSELAAVRLSPACVSHARIAGRRQTGRSRTRVGQRRQDGGQSKRLVSRIDQSNLGMEMDSGNDGTSLGFNEVSRETEG